MRIQWRCITVMVCLCLGLVWAGLGDAAAEGVLVKRKLMALYSSKETDSPMNSLTHMFLEMPANHLGLDVVYYDIEKPLPKVEDDVRGIVIWLGGGRNVRDPYAYIDWLEKAMDSGVKILIMENLGIGDDMRLAKGGMDRLNQFLYKFGMKDLNMWSSITYASEVVEEDKAMVGFERPLPKALPPYLGTVAIQGRSVSHLRVRTHIEPEYVSDLIITTPKGGYVSGGYAIFEGYPLISLDTQERLKKRKDRVGKMVTYEQIANTYPPQPKVDGTPAEIEAHKKAQATKVNPMPTTTTKPKEKRGESAPSVAMKAMPSVIGEDATGKKVSEVTPVDPMDAAIENTDPLIQQWYINPFLFLTTTLNLKGMPMPDVTTLNGKRLFYSHIDGDGWNNISEIDAYKKRRAISAEVIMEEVLKKYTDIPTSVSVITGEMVDDCYGRPESARIAREIFKLPNVEPASHTHTHPLYWQYFKDGDVAKELPLLGMYPDKPSAHRGLYSVLTGAGQQEDDWKEFFEKNPDMQAKRGQKTDFTNKYYETPRSFACGPFNVTNEIGASADIVNSLAPEGKKMRIVQWSGNTSPYEEVLRKTREAGFANINGGDSRYDFEYPSYTSVSPIGIQVGKERQIYSSNSNENTYTNLWTDRFFGFKYLKATAENTDRPMRVQPFNIYYHIYSGQKQASLGALKENLDFARAQDIIPVMAADFAFMAQDFYNVKIMKLSEDHYKVLNYGRMPTIRFDDAVLLGVNMERSEGVLGFRYYQGAMYVALNPDTKEADIVLTRNEQIGYYPRSSVPYLIDSRWVIKNLTIVNKSLMFATQGYGRGIMHWHMPSQGAYNVQVKQNNNIILTKVVQTDDNSILEVDLKNQSNALLNIEISPAQQ